MYKNIVRGALRIAAVRTVDGRREKLRGHTAETANNLRTTKGELSTARAVHGVWGRRVEKM